MNRRGFLASCLALSLAPAIVRASSLMPVRVYQTDVFAQIREVVRMMKEQHIPPGPDGNYVAFVSPTWGDILRREAQPLAGFDLFTKPARGEIVCLDGIRFIEADEYFLPPDPKLPPSIKWGRLPPKWTR